SIGTSRICQMKNWRRQANPLFLGSLFQTATFQGVEIGQCVPELRVFRFSTEAQLKSLRSVRDPFVVLPLLSVYFGAIRVPACCRIHVCRWIRIPPSPPPVLSAEK